MTTVVNTPPTSDSSGGPMGLILGLVAILAFAYIFIMYGIPAMRNIGGTPQINVPDKIDVNVKQQK